MIEQYLFVGACIATYTLCSFEISKGYRVAVWLQVGVLLTLLWPVWVLGWFVNEMRRR